MTALDTNVLIYACDREDPRKQQRALDLIANSHGAVLLWQVACEFVAASRKLSHQGFTPEHAWNRLSDFLDLFTLAVPGNDVLKRAQAFHLRDGWSLWDALIVSACLDCGVDQLYSEDLPGRAAPAGLKITDPFA